ncbi:uncharacterized protein LOC131579942 [Poecile atricapillus]|uniref:uncharacterized protein LOC131579942 n=1 Tax=Poecile atricapillus TaxID=48891 RepID=UPI002739DA2D|nr:uncharacterized protein LOC131579942 [Poecile atricapillus]
MQRRRLKQLVKKGQLWKFAEVLLAQDESRAAEQLRRALPYLDSPQEPLREAAVKFIGIAGRYLRKQQEETQLIYKALQDLTDDISPAVSSLALETVQLLAAQRAPYSPGFRRCKTTSRRVGGRKPLLWGSLCCHAAVAEAPLAQRSGPTEASWKTLLCVAKFMQRRRLKQLVKKGQLWKFAEVLLAQDESRAAEQLRRALPYLDSPQEPLREAAVKFIGIAGRYLRKQQEETQLIYKALQDLTDDISPAVSSLALETVQLLAAQRAPYSPGFRRCKTTSRRVGGRKPLLWGSLCCEQLIPGAPSCSGHLSLQGRPHLGMEI